VRRFLLLLIVAIVAYGSLYPWNFEFTSTAGNPVRILLHGWPAEWNRYILRDIVLNVTIYMPLGLAAVLAFRQRRSRGFAATAAIAFGFLLSVGMELLQVYVPGRDPSLLDVLTNTLGTAAGAGVAIYFESGIRRLMERRAGQFRAAATLLLLVWAVGELYPLFPEIGRSHLRQELTLLFRFRGLSVVETWANAAEWFAAGLALDAILAHMRTFGLAIAMLCVPAQMFIAGRSLTPAEIAGALLALALWHFVRRESRARWCAWMLGSAILLRQFQPFYFLAVPQPFSWIPFAATLESSRDAATAIIARKAFDYGALIWALRCAGQPFVRAGLAVAVALGATEAIQTYLPGRSPEITDPLLALLMMVLLRSLSPAAGKTAGNTAGKVT
jgi:VanZ family protein